MLRPFWGSDSLTIHYLLGEIPNRREQVALNCPDRWVWMVDSTFGQRRNRTRKRRAPFSEPNSSRIPSQFFVTMDTDTSWSGWKKLYIWSILLYKFSCFFKGSFYSSDIIMFDKVFTSIVWLTCGLRTRRKVDGLPGVSSLFRHYFRFWLRFHRHLGSCLRRLPANAWVATSRVHVQSSSKNTHDIRIYNIHTYIYIYTHMKRHININIGGPLNENIYLPRFGFIQMIIHFTVITPLKLCVYVFLSSANWKNLIFFPVQQSRRYLEMFPKFVPKQHRWYRWFRWNPKSTYCLLSMNPPWKMGYSPYQLVARISSMDHFYWMFISSEFQDTRHP